MHYQGSLRLAMSSVAKAIIHFRSIPMRASSLGYSASGKAGSSIGEHPNVVRREGMTVVGEPERLEETQGKNQRRKHLAGSLAVSVPGPAEH